MKRIYNDIPLQSVLYFIPGDTILTIYDMKLNDVYYNRENGEHVGTWEGLAKDSVNIPTRYQYAKVYHMEAHWKNHIVFYVSTQFEQY